MALTNHLRELAFKNGTGVLNYFTPDTYIEVVMDEGVKERFRKITKPVYEAAMRDMLRRRRHEHMLILRLMHNPSFANTQTPNQKLFFHSRLEAEKGIGAALLRDPFRN